ncbi:MAG: SAM-dependent methyltransferase [Pseudomonadota bacterium]|nr:SAM-dependent methyltransferase [Pseudomonadota bacterium]
MSSKRVVGADATQQFLDILADSLTDSSLIKLSLSKYHGTQPKLQRLAIRPIVLKAEPHLSFVYSYQTKDITKNHVLIEGLNLIQQLLLSGDFRSAHLRTVEQEAQLLLNKRLEPHLQTKALLSSGQSAISATQSHNRSKHRYLTLDRPFLTALGVTDQQRQLIPSMSRKWKQINKFIEIFDHAFRELNHPAGQAVHVVDFGSGKGYLTFAIREYIEQQLGCVPQVTGVELREDLVGLCNRAVQQLDLTGLGFYQGDVRSYQPEQVDVMIALHACDIATDYALHTGIRLNASIIMCAPCCHKELRPQLQSPDVLRPMLHYGVHLGQQAEMLTDSLRALLLEAHGYETKVFEFVALEHTSKNKMILAIKKSASAHKKTEVLAQVTALKKFYGIQQQCLEELLAQ